MVSPRSLDARPDQLKLLKLENRQMKPLARVLLDSRAARPVKKAALAAAAAALVSLQSAPAEYAARIGVQTFDAEASTEAFNQARNALSELAALVEHDAGKEALFASIAGLFRTIDGEHARLETMARTIGARLLETGPRAVGDGGGNKNPPLMAWLGLMSSDNVVDGGGTKDPLSTWLLNSPMSGR